MTLIRQLEPAVADAIAAGEVVERPASAVKELLENSLDAGATRINIEIRGAGRTLIRVADDGGGIAPDELRLAFTRHATSKVTSIGDLEAIASLGFRGEALASIAAVADVEARSGRARIRLRAGRVVEEGHDSQVSGTVVEVRDLFFSTPARLKFLRSEATETAAALRTVNSYAQLYPGVRFELTVDGRQALSTPGDGDLLRAAAAVHGRRIAEELMPLEGDSVWGAVTQPRLSRGNREGILLAVNRRPITSRSLSYALEECYLGSLERGRFPLAILDLVVDPHDLDVNVHPTKREVRFRAEGAVFAALQQAVRAALHGSSRPHTLQVGERQADAPNSLALHQLNLHDGLAPALAAQGPGVEVPAGFLRPLGQVMDGYLVAEGPDGLVLVDQHAAHERILYNRFLARIEAGGGPSQAILLPDTLDVEPRLVAAASEHRGRLRNLGFEVEEFGPRTLRILAAPVETPPARVAGALQELLGELASSRSGSMEKAAASIACHSAVRFGDTLDQAEQRQLLDELELAADAITCPHGRPTRLLIEWQDLKRHFRRNY